MISSTGSTWTRGPPPSWPTAWSQPGSLTAGQQTVRIADDGAQLRAKIAGSISAVTAPLYESLSSSDVETTVRTLRYLTTRVRAVNSRPGRPTDPADPADPAEGPGGAHDHAEPAR